MNRNGKCTIEVRPQIAAAAPMAEERETAQWYTVNSGMDEIRAVINTTTKGLGHSGMIWNRLPPETKDALRREFYRIRAIGEQIDRDNQAKEAAPKVGFDEAGSMVVDITPESLKTPEGIAKVNKATRELDHATATLANAATEFIEDYAADILMFVPSLRDDVANLRRVIVERKAKTDGFLRAMANQPPRS